MIGASGDDVNTLGDAGSAYVYARSGGIWSQEARLVASDAASSDSFGLSVAVSGDTALVGAYAKTSQTGAAYVFTRSGGVWTQQAKLTASDAASSDRFGYSVALEGDTALIGAYMGDGLVTNSGSAYVFFRSGTTWTQQAELNAADGSANDYFGYAVALSGDTALVSAREDDGVRGSAYVFVRSGGTWSQQARLVASTRNVLDYFGVSVALEGDVAIVGTVNAGRVYAFTRSGVSWSQSATITPPPPAPALFGDGLALNNNVALIGAVWDSTGAFHRGSVLVYTLSGGVWTHDTTFYASARLRPGPLRLSSGVGRRHDPRGRDLGRQPRLRQRRRGRRLLRLTRAR